MNRLSYLSRLAGLIFHPNPNPSSRERELSFPLFQRGAKGDFMFYLIVPNSTKKNTYNKGYVITNRYKLFKEQSQMAKSLQFYELQRLACIY